MGKTPVMNKNEIADHRRKASLAASSVCSVLYVGYVVTDFIAISVHFMTITAFELCIYFQTWPISHLPLMFSLCHIPYTDNFRKRFVF